MKLALIAASLILAGSAQAQSLKEKYELSERCSKRAAETFEKEWGTGFHNAEFGNYESHYNARLNKCFYLLTSDTYESGIGITRLMILIDLQGNTEIGSYSATTRVSELTNSSYCRVQEKFCKSEQEFRALVKPYMED